MRFKYAIVFAEALGHRFALAAWETRSRCGFRLKVRRDAGGSIEPIITFARGNDELAEWAFKTANAII